ncbi:MAG: tetratricopeptide repeat protein [Phycisphaeraceae bacterium]|nr:tetratricopeptide repeat protein [Phycisphaeraceae bacterium]
MKLTTKMILSGLTAGVVLLGTAGCNSNQTKSHKAKVNAANARWMNLRSTLMLQMAQQQFDTGDLEQAERTTADAISIDPKNGRLHVLAGRIALERSQLERAYQRLQTASELDPKLAEAHYYQGIVLQRWQRFDDALAAYRQAYELQADNPGYLLAISEMLISTDKVEEARALLTEKVAYFDQSAAIRGALGQVYLIQNKPAEAADYFRQASLLRPDDMQLIESLALAQVEAGQNQAAIASFGRLAKDEKRANSRHVLFALAAAYERNDQPAQAKDIYLKLTRQDSADAEPWIKLGEIAWAQQDTAGTLLAANRVINIAPKRSEGYLLAGLVWQKRGNVDEALRNFDRAAELAPQSNDAVILRGITLQQAGRTSAAAQAYAEALRRRPDDSRAQELLASVPEADR